ncbi:unnamed protein product [Paramecium octaurelia]|uniref:Uncharacterized protein n=1 Tax=Paramecium octaurelia TaxID=43137 RepID=A0A8S1VUS9_PAROT|nr:unnamed protein product [Paramecium octaurelia]
MKTLQYKLNLTKKTIIQLKRFEKKKSYILADVQNLQDEERQLIFETTQKLTEDGKYPDK